MKTRLEFIGLRVFKTFILNTYLPYLLSKNKARAVSLGLERPLKDSSLKSANVKRYFGCGFHTVQVRDLKKWEIKKAPLFKGSRSLSAALNWGDFLGRSTYYFNPPLVPVIT